VTSRPHHVVNEALVLTDEALPETAVDLALSATRIAGRHGVAAAARYRHFLGRALAAQPDAIRDDLLTLAALAAWRSGALAFRTDALRRLDLARAEGSTRPAALAAALGLDEDSLAPFTALQRETRFGWPGLTAPGNLLAVIGGFRGLFGPWQAPPVAVLAGNIPGAFVIRASAVGGDAEEWQVLADVFGHTLVRLTADPAGPADAITANERWAGAGDSAESLDEAGAAGGAVLQVRAYSARLYRPGTAR
jgi:hypothetical protein